MRGRDIITLIYIERERGGDVSSEKREKSSLDHKFLSLASVVKVSNLHICILDQKFPT